MVIRVQRGEYTGENLCNLIQNAQTHHYPTFLFVLYALSNGVYYIEFPLDVAGNPVLKPWFSAFAIYIQDWTNVFQKYMLGTQMELGQLNKFLELGMKLDTETLIVFLKASAKHRARPYIEWALLNMTDDPLAIALICAKHNLVLDDATEDYYFDYCIKNAADFSRVPDSKSWPELAHLVLVEKRTRFVRAQAEVLFELTTVPRDWWFGKFLLPHIARTTSTHPSAKHAWWLICRHAKVEINTADPALTPADMQHMVCGERVDKKKELLRLLGLPDGVDVMEEIKFILK
jgi:hypothetical protein